MSINPPAGPLPPQAGPPYPAAGPGSARAHVRRLRQDGGTYRGIANAAGLDRATVSDLDRGRRLPNRATAAAVLAVTSTSVPRGRTDAGGSRLRLRALHVMGHGSARIARALGVREMTIRQIVRGDARTVSPGLRDTVTELYDAWWDKRPPPAPPSTAPRPPPPQTRHRRELVRRRRPRRRLARHPRLPAPARLETRRRHGHRPRHPAARRRHRGDHR